MTLATSAILGFVVTLVACPLVLRVIKRRVLDQPNARSSHDRATPRGGGVAVAVGALLAVAVCPGLSTWRTPLVLASASFGALGLVDDLRPIPALARLGAQFALAAVTLPFLVRDLTGAATWRILFAAGVLLWPIACVNALNFMDGINGITAAQVVIAGAAWWAIGRSEDIRALAAGGLIVAACALAFAPFNYPRAQMFLGDVGSYFLGGWLAVLVVVGLRSGIPFEAVIGPVAVALVDTLSTIVRRLRRHETWYEAHREHVYQRLVRAGWSHTVTTAFVALIVAGCSLAGMATLASPAWPVRLVIDAVGLTILAAYLGSADLVDRIQRQPAPGMVE